MQLNWKMDNLLELVFPVYVDIAITHITHDRIEFYASYR